LPELHAAASSFVDEFAAQYPLHPYAVLAKAFQLAYLRRDIARYTSRGLHVVELAIGDGTLSQRIFEEDAVVVGADISPYVLRFAASMPHVDAVVICDCLDPPFEAGSFDLLVSNNFLHHVSAKEATLAVWTRIASSVMFNENTRYWATSWFRPTMLRSLGLRRASVRAADAIEEAHFQSLRSADELDAIAAAAGNVIGRASYFDARTFSISALFSALMMCSGPPTPPRVKAILAGRLRLVGLPLTRLLCRSLIAFDAGRSRERDTYIAYTLATGAERVEDRGLVCPSCSARLVEGDNCPKCGDAYPIADGMRFVLPRHLRHIYETYDAELASRLSAEQL
jgi:uncharacterized protein YbaR (Trm112 family)